MRLIHILLLVAHCFTLGLSQGYYKVIGSRVIRPNSEYNAAVSIEASSVPTTVTVSLLGTFPPADQTLTIPPYSTRIARLEVGDIPPGNYKLLVKGVGGVNFQDSLPLQYVRKSYSVLIQTDKVIYKPGHKILFRVLILDSQLRSPPQIRNEPITVHISDGEGNIVKQWKNVFANRGVFTNELQLSNDPVLGKWNISVTIREQIFSKSVQVAVYVSPKFLINIQAPTHLTFKDNILIAHIQSLYNYGKKVKGDATVTVYPTIYSGVIQPIFQNPVRKVLPIDGSATVEFDVANELKLSDEYERTVIVDVTIEEARTGRRQNNSVEVHLHKYDYKMEIVKTADYFKPGLKYTAYIKVSNHNGSPIKSDQNSVTVRYGYSRINEVYVDKKHELDSNGIIKLELYTPRNATNETALRIEAQYQDLKERMPPVPAAVSPSNTFLQASIGSEQKPLVNSIVDVVVNCTEPMKIISYELLGRGDVLLANSFQVQNQKEFRFHITATQAMVPLSHLIVNYVRENGELVADSFNIETEGLLQNDINIQVNAVETEPETEVDLIISSQPNSYIGLLAVDQMIGRLKQGYDLTHQQVADELQSYDISPLSPYYAVMKDSNSHFFWKPGASNSFDTFYDSGAVVITNARLAKYKPTLEDIYLRPVSYGSSTVKPDRGVGLSFHTVTRPPLAGPYAFSRIPRPVWDKPKVYLTEDIADTWIFSNFSLGSDGKTSVRRRVPNTLNTWVITGFSLDPLHGLGLVNSPKKLKVSKNFFVTLDLPHSIQRGETLAVPVVVYNNFDKDITAEVTIHNSEQKFEFADIEDGNSTKKIELYRKKTITVKRNSGASVAFMITPLKLNHMEIRVSASSFSGKDSTSKHLLVKAEGETQYYTKSVLIDLRKTNSYKGNITISLPKNAVPGSEKIKISVVGDLLGPTIIHLDNLIRLPTGTGEQNMVHFVPSLIILTYLMKTNQITYPIFNEAISNLETAYQKQLTFKRPDGSFSAFGKNDVNGSVWITAYVAMAMKQAKEFIYVDENITENALKWLADKQGIDGSFAEFEPIIHQDVQNSNNSNLGLTAFTLLAFIENQKTSAAYNNLINKGLDYIARNLKEQNSVYTIAICSYVLHLAKHSSKEIAFNLLESKAMTANNSKWWGKPFPQKEAANPWHYLPKSMDIETTSYALLTLLETKFIDDAVPVVNWLLQQQNSLGGFASSQDTTIGLYALYKLVTKLAMESNMQVEFSYRKQQTDRLGINRDNALIVQEVELSNDARVVNISAQGQGVALFRVSYQYNMNVSGPWPLFTLDPQVDKNSNVDHLQLSICSAFVSRNLTSKNSSNMAIMEVNLPSGFTADVDSLPSLEVSQNVRKVETKNGDTTVVLYFNNFTKHEHCPTVSAFRTHKVAKQKPVSVVVYDYYDTSRRARIFYRGRTATLCDICEDDDCTNVCSSAESQKAEESKEKDGSGEASAYAACVHLIFLILLCHTLTIS